MVSFGRILSLFVQFHQAVPVPDSRCKCIIFLTSKALMLAVHTRDTWLRSLERRALALLLQADEGEEERMDSWLALAQQEAEKLLPAQLALASSCGRPKRQDAYVVKVSHHLPASTCPCLAPRPICVRVPACTSLALDARLVIICT